MGAIRPYPYVVGRILWPKHYKVRVSYLPHPVDKVTGLPDVSRTLPEVELPPLSEPVPSDWTVKEDYFKIVYAINCSHLDPITVLSKESSLDDGVIWMVFVMHHLSRYDSFRWLLNSGDGLLKDNPGMYKVPARAFRIEPIHPMDGFMSLDAESVKFESLQGRSLRGKARLLSEK